jgi:hypothetical protein
MHAIKARVRNGKLELDDSEPLVEGAEFWLVPANNEEQDDDMTPEERAELEAALTESIEEMRAGKTIDGPEFLARLRAER